MTRNFAQGASRCQCRLLQPLVHLLDIGQALLDRLQATPTAADITSDDLEISRKIRNWFDAGKNA